MKRLLLLPLLLLLTAPQCESPTPEGGTEYCRGNDPNILEQAYEYAYSAIIGGDQSSDRRATVRVRFGQSYCSGVVIGPHTVLTAAHCGYGEATVHLIVLDDQTYTETDHFVHPDYWAWVEAHSLEGRKSDLMLIYVAETLPGPYPLGTYSKSQSDVCNGLLAQGWGRWEGSGLSLRETNYLISAENQKTISSKNQDTGKICFGDSGGPLYADVDGELYIAGITSTTMSQDCLTGGTHIKVSFFSPWIYENMEPPI